MRASNVHLLRRPFPVRVETDSVLGGEGSATLSSADPEGRVSVLLRLSDADQSRMRQQPALGKALAAAASLAGDSA